MSAYSTNALYKHTVWQEIFGGQKFRGFLKIVSVSKFRVFVARPTNRTSTTHSANEEEEDPGMFFVLYPPSKVHAALALSSVANISPGLHQGKKNY